MIGIIGAMDEEVKKLREMIQNGKVVKKAGMEFFCGILGKREVVVVHSGIGKVNAAICTQILVDCFGIEGVINTGIAGSLKSEINIGDIVVSTDAVQHDVDATNFGYALGQIPRMDVLAFPTDKMWRERAVALCKKVNPEIQVFEGRVVSGDQFISDQGVKDGIVENFAGYCTEMEGASIAQVAYVNHIPCLILRAISDKADGSATVDYPTFEAQAIEHCVRLTKALVGEEGI